MANTNAPFGLRPVRHLSGGDIRSKEYSIASEYGTSIFTGDVVELTSTSNQLAKAAADNDDNIGVFAGCRYVDATGKQHFSRYWPASTVATEIVAYVYDDPQIVFEVQADTVAVTDYGALATWNVGTGSTATGNSGLYCDVSSGTATTAKQLRILGLSPRVGNEAGAYAKIEVLFAEHALARVVGGVGGI